MQGHFDLQMLHTPGLTRELIEAVRREGGDSKVEEYLRRFQQEGEWHTDNLVYQIYPGYLFYNAMSATSAYGTAIAGSGLSKIMLTTIASEPAYTVVNSANIYQASSYDYNLPDSPVPGSTSPFKMFVDDCIVAHTIASDAGGRESIYGKFKWLYLPGECTSDQIRSISIWGSTTTIGGFSNHTRHARVRIKDSGGNPVTINKAATKSLLVEYTFTMVSL